MRAATDTHDPHHQSIDAALRQWRQGDCVLGEHVFVHYFDPEAPLTRESTEVAGMGVDVVASAVRGFVVLTQTCDIVRRSTDRPYYVKVAPLVEVEAHIAHEIERGRRPSYAFIPALRTARLVADLDRSMTVEKAVVAKWLRTAGWETDNEARRLALALSRQRSRFAFPDDFAKFAHRLHTRLLEKHDRQSEEGRTLRALREIRVQAAPAWDALEVEVFFWFIRGAESMTFEGKNWDDYCQAWLDLLPPMGRFTHVDGVVVALEDLTAKDYVESDPLDLDYLSTRTE